MSTEPKMKNQGPGGGPGGGPGRHGFRKPKNPVKTLARMFSYLSGNTPVLILAFVMVIMSALAGVLAAYLLKPIINNLTDNLKTYINSGLTSDAARNKVFADLTVDVLKMAVIYLCGAVGTYLSSRLMVSVAQKTANKMRKELFEKLQDLPISYFDRHPHGEVMSRFTNDMDSVAMALEQSLSQTVTSFISVVGTFIMMVVLSPLLALVAVLMVVLMMFIVKKVGGKSAKNFRNQQAALGDLDGYIEEMMQGQKVVKVFNHENIASKEFAEKNNKLKNAATRAQTFANILMPIMGNLSYFHYAVTATLGAIMIVNPFGWGGIFVITLGDLGAFLQYTRQFAQPITQISNQTNMLLSALAGAERIFEVLDENPERDCGKVRLVLAEKQQDGKLCEVAGDPFKNFATTFKEDNYLCLAWKTPENSEGRATLTELRGDVRFENVTFSYVPGHVVLNNVSLYAKPGQKIAFVGSTGAGKTTITNLINRFYEIDEGTITYDGIDIKDICKEDLRRTLGIVLQDVHLFKGTIRDNIRYGKLDATDEEIIRAAKIANAHSFIKKLPDGYDTMLTADGMNLSQGQRQLLSIARAAVADPPVIILDEATSSIDTRTEHLIEDGMDKLMQDRTTFVIAHRLSTVRNSNAIMVLEHGNIIERGDHDDLLEQKGRYYSLYTGKAELT